MTDAATRRAADPDLAALVAGRVRDVPDFPEPGVGFKDLTPLFGDGPAFRAVVDGILARFADNDGGPPEVVAGVEARGFLIASALAYAAGCGVVPIRKAGKLPWRTLSASYSLEYGEATVEVHTDAFESGARVLLVDDVLATGGTLAAALDLVARAGALARNIAVLLELEFLRGRERVSAHSPEADLYAVLTV